MVPNQQAVLDVRTPLRTGPRARINLRRGSGRRDQLSQRLPQITSAPRQAILPIAAVVLGLIASAAWSTFLAFELWQLIRLLWA
jgi:hypothetical protein